MNNAISLLRKIRKRELGLNHAAFSENMETEQRNVTLEKAWK